MNSIHPRRRRMDRAMRVSGLPWISSRNTASIRLLSVLVLAACGGPSALPRQPVAESSCDAADEGRRLASEGRIDRAARLLADPARCAHPPADVVALLTDLRSKLVRAGDP